MLFEKSSQELHWLTKTFFNKNIFSFFPGCSCGVNAEWKHIIVFWKCIAINFACFGEGLELQWYFRSCHLGEGWQKYKLPVHQHCLWQEPMSFCLRWSELTVDMKKGHFNWFQTEDWTSQQNSQLIKSVVLFERRNTKYCLLRLSMERVITGRQIHNNTDTRAHHSLSTQSLSQPSPDLLPTPPATVMISRDQWNMLRFSHFNKQICIKY